MGVFHVESNFTLQVIKSILRENSFKGFEKMATQQFLFKARSEIPFRFLKANHLTGSYMSFLLKGVFEQTKIHYQIREGIDIIYLDMVYILYLVISVYSKP